MTDTSRESERVGTTLSGKWRLDRVLGVGGMAAVYAATHRNGKRGAVKILHPELSRDANARERFLREGYVANRIEHPGVVQVLDDDVASDGAVYLVMELLEGRTLEEMVESLPGKQLQPDVASDLMSQLLDVLAAAHAKGVVHRDLKPENLFLTTAGRLKVLDFGIARLREPNTDKRTQTGSVMGTPAFMPPEQALGDWHRVDHRTDIWAVGATFFTLLTGRLVHEAETMNKLLLAAMTRPAPPLASVLGGAHPRLAEVVDRALEFEPSRRFQSAADMKLALLSLRDASPMTIASAAGASTTTDVPAASSSTVASSPITAATVASAGPGALAGGATLVAGDPRAGARHATLEPSMRSMPAEPRTRLAPALVVVGVLVGIGGGLFAWRTIASAPAPVTSAGGPAPQLVVHDDSSVTLAPEPPPSSATLTPPASADGQAEPPAPSASARPVPAAPRAGKPAPSAAPAATETPIPQTAQPTATAAPSASSKGRDFDGRF